MSLWSWLFHKISQPAPQAPRERGSEPFEPDEMPVQTATVTESNTPPAASRSTEGGSPWWIPVGDANLDPVEPEAETSSPGIAFLENVLVSHFDGHDLTMPLLNSVVERVLPRLGSPNCNIKEITREIGEDQVLAAAVLRTANSPMYRGIQKTSSVSAAVTRIGVKALRTILLHQSMRSAVFGKSSLTRQFANSLWKKSLADACVMRGLAGVLNADQDEHHLIGLMHDIGSILVLRIINDQLKQGCATIDQDAFEYLRRNTHQEFGELIARAWQLPPDLTSLITDHHSNPAPNDPLARQRWMLCLTEMIGGMLYSDTPRNYDILNCTAARSLGLTNQPRFAQWLEQLPKQIDEVLGEADA